MPFGLCNAPGKFQSLIQTIFHEKLLQILLVYRDDIVYSDTIADHGVMRLARGRVLCCPKSRMVSSESSPMLADVYVELRER